MLRCLEDPFIFVTLPDLALGVSAFGWFFVIFCYNKTVIIIYGSFLTSGDHCCELSNLRVTVGTPLSVAG